MTCFDEIAPSASSSRRNSSASSVAGLGVSFDVAANALSAVRSTGSASQAIREVMIDGTAPEKTSSPSP